MDSNHRPLGYEPNELPLLYATMYYFKELILCIYIYTNIRKKFQNTKYFFLVEVMGIEPMSKYGFNKPHSQA